MLVAGYIEHTIYNSLALFLIISILIPTMTVRMRHTRSHTRNRRSHHALGMPRLSTCPKCSALHLRHKMCTNCGTYRGREVVDVMKRIVKKAEKMKNQSESQAQTTTPEVEKSANEEKK